MLQDCQFAVQFFVKSVEKKNSGGIYRGGSGAGCREQIRYRDSKYINGVCFLSDMFSHVVASSMGI